MDKSVENIKKVGAITKYTKTQRTFDILVELGVYKEEDSDLYCKSKVMMKEPLYVYLNLEKYLTGFDFQYFIKSNDFPEDLTEIDLNPLELLKNNKIDYAVFGRYVSHLNYLCWGAIDVFYYFVYLNKKHDYSFNVGEVDFLLKAHKLNYFNVMENKDVLGVAIGKGFSEEFLNYHSTTFLKWLAYAINFDSKFDFIEFKKFHSIPEEIQEDDLDLFLLYDKKLISEALFDSYSSYLDYLSFSDLYYIVYLDQKNGFDLTYDERRFLFLSAKYGRGVFEERGLAEKLIDRKLNRNGFYKASILIDKLGFDYETLNKYIFNTVLCDYYFKDKDLIEVGELILDDDIDWLIKEIEDEKAEKQRVKVKRSEVIQLGFNDIPYYESVDAVEVNAIYVGRKWGSKMNLIAVFKDISTSEYFKVNIYKDFKKDRYGNGVDFRKIAFNTLLKMDLALKKSSISEDEYTVLASYSVQQENYIQDKYEIY